MYFLDDGKPACRNLTRTCHRGHGYSEIRLARKRLHATEGEFWLQYGNARTHKARLEADIRSRQSKLVALRAEHCSRIISKIAELEQRLEEVKARIDAMVPPVNLIELPN